MNHISQYEDHVSLWGKKLGPWVPEAIFDAHVHLGPPEAMGKVPSARKKVPLCTFSSYTWENARDMYSKLYNSKSLVGLIAFPFPLHEVNYELANNYVAQLIREESRITGFILSNPFDTKSTIAQFDAAEKAGARFRGVKPYYDLLKRDISNSLYVSDTSDFVPDDLLHWMNEQHLIMMLHTCSIGMGDPQCQKWIVRAVERFPNIKIILAHMGRYLQEEQFFDFFDTGIMDHPNLFLEMSSASRPNVYARMLTRLDWCKRLLFGSDVPYGLITGQEYVPRGGKPTFITRDEYDWSDPLVHKVYEEERRELTYNTYHTINALKIAMDCSTLSDDEKCHVKDDVFRNNTCERLLS